MRIFLDDFNHIAKITKIKIYPYDKAPQKEDSFVLKIVSRYNKNMCIFLSIYETEQDAINRLKTFGCGSFKEITTNKGE